MENGLSSAVLEQKLAELARENAELKARLAAMDAIAPTPPSEEADSCTFTDLFDLDEIQKIQDAFAAATGIASIITHPDGTPLTRPSNFCRLCSEIIRNTEVGLRNCLQSDALLGRHNPDGPIIAPCHSGGLWDGGASISVGDRHLANWLIGQVRNEELDEEAMVRYAGVIGADEGEFRAALAEVTYMSREQFAEIGKFLFLIANLLSKVAFQNMALRRTIAELKLEAEKREKLEKQLRHAQKLEAVGRLAGGVAHDFNNLLSVINGYAELILLDLDPLSPLRQKIETIHGAGQRASRLTQQLVAFSRKQIIDPVPVHLGRELTEINKMLIRLLGEDITVTIHQADGLWMTRIDLSQLEQVIVNLAVNARDAMPTGGHLVFEATNIAIDEPFIHDRYEIRPGEYVLLAVSDTGSGMPREVLDKIFEPFFTTKGVNKGTGLGLAMVYGIVKQHDGYISVYSEEGRGTTFRLYFPRCDVQATPLGTRDSNTPILRKGSETILLVEDEETVRELCHTILAQLGYNVIAATNGKDALRVASRHHGGLDLLLTDVVMPEMNGPDIAQQLRCRFPGLCVLFMSGYTENAIVHHGVLEKNINFIHKPITPQKLALAVHAALEGARAAAAGQASPKG